MKSNFLPLLLVYALASEPVLNGVQTVSAVKSYKAKVRAIDESVKAMSDQALGRTLGVRTRKELIASLEEDAVEPKEGTLPANNAAYKAVKELISSLEDDYTAIQGGDLKRRTAYRKNHNQFREAFALLNNATGAYRQAPRKVTRRNVTPVRES